MKKEFPKLIEPIIQQVVETIGDPFYQAASSHWARDDSDTRSLEEFWKDYNKKIKETKK